MTLIFTPYAAIAVNLLPTYILVIVSVNRIATTYVSAFASFIEHPLNRCMAARPFISMLAIQAVRYLRIVMHRKLATIQRLTLVMDESNWVQAAGSSEQRPESRATSPTG